MTNNDISITINLRDRFAQPGFDANFRLPDWHPRDPPKQRLETVGGMAHHRNHCCSCTWNLSSFDWLFKSFCTRSSTILVLPSLCLRQQLRSRHPGAKPLVVQNEQEWASRWWLNTIKWNLQLLTCSAKYVLAISRLLMKCVENHQRWMSISFQLVFCCRVIDCQFGYLFGLVEEKVDLIFKPKSRSGIVFCHKSFGNRFWSCSHYEVPSERLTYVLKSFGYLVRCYKRLSLVALLPVLLNIAISNNPLTASVLTGDRSKSRNALSEL